MADIEAFKNNIIGSGYVLDPEGIHHEFVSGMHGRKLDFDNIHRENPLYYEWVGVTTDYIQEQFPRLPEVIIGVANGTNRLALDVARQFDGRVVGLVSEKDKKDSKVLRLSDIASKIISGLEPELVVVLEDVGTTGSNSVQVANECLTAGAEAVEVVVTWKRRRQLEKLDADNIPYRALIDEELTTYEPEDCRDHGFCAQGWEFIERGK